MLYASLVYKEDNYKRKRTQRFRNIAYSFENNKFENEQK